MKMNLVKKDELVNFNTKLLMLRPPEKGSNMAERPSHKIHKDSMMGAIRPALCIARPFGFLPIPILDSDGNGNDFKWRSFRSFYAIVVLLILLSEAILSIARLAVVGVSIQSSVNAVFFSITFVAGCIFLQLALSWKSIVRGWGYVEEKVMGSYGWPRNLRRKMLCMTIFLVTFGFVEFLLATCSTFSKFWMRKKKHGLARAFEKYCIKEFERIFSVTNFAVWKAFILFLIQITGNCIWNFIDLVIILISMALSARFRLLNDLIFSCDGQERPIEFWRRTRETYFTLSELTHETDRCLGTLILLSFAGNLYFICVQLMNSVSSKNTSVMNDIYFAFSMLYLSLRTCLVGLTAAQIYEESKRPKEVLYNVPTENYSVEVAGTVVTYEIILVQFNPANDLNDDNTFVSSNATNSTYM